MSQYKYNNPRYIGAPQAVSPAKPMVRNQYDFDGFNNTPAVGYHSPQYATVPTIAIVRAHPPDELPGTCYPCRCCLSLTFSTKLFLTLNAMCVLYDLFLLLFEYLTIREGLGGRAPELEDQYALPWSYFVKKNEIFCKHVYTGTLSIYIILLLINCIQLIAIILFAMAVLGQLSIKTRIRYCSFYMIVNFSFLQVLVLLIDIIFKIVKDETEITKKCFQEDSVYGYFASLCVWYEIPQLLNGFVGRSYRAALKRKYCPEFGKPTGPVTEPMIWAYNARLEDCF